MNKQEFIGKLETAINGMADAFAKKGKNYPEEFNDIPGADVLGIPEPKKGASHDRKVEPYVPVMREFIKVEAGKLFAPWKDMPDPGAFEQQIQHVVTAKGKIANKDVTSVGDIQSMQLGTQMPGYMTEVRTNLAGWRGDTVNTVNRNYVE